MPQISLVKGTYNIIDSIKFNSDMTDKTVVCRIKTKLEDRSPPLIQSEVVFTDIGTTSSVGYVELDLSTTPDLTGEALMDFKISDTNNPTKKSYVEPFKILIKPSLSP